VNTKVQIPRDGWSKLFQEMHLNGDDKLLCPDVFYDEKTVES